MTRFTRHLALVTAAALLPCLALAQNGSCHGTDNYNCFLLWAPESEIPAIAQGHGLTVLEQLDANNPDVVLASGPGNVLPETTLENLDADPLVIAVEMLETTAVTEAASGVDLNQSYATILDSIDDQGAFAGGLADFFSTPLWEGYANQPVGALIGLHPAHAYLDADKDHEAPYGYGIVAVIDTGVDPTHPALLDALVPGYDFLLDQPGGASEWESLDPASRAAIQGDLEMVADQSYATILDGDGEPFFINPSAGPIIDQSYATILDGHSLPPAFGHGTMVAGIIRLTAPGAQIMPLRVFDGNGTANIFDVARAIRWATDNGANVINMSFSTEFNSPELMRAVNYANRNGVVCVAAAGNTSQRNLRYPAAFGNVIGVNSSDKLDSLSPFSNRGPDVVALAAPGEGVITTYPGGGYAAAWGTSFSSAFVSGTVALLHQVEQQGNRPIDFKPTDYYRASFVLEGSAEEPVSNPDWGNGRLDILTTVENRVNRPGGMNDD